jgi:exodeoxyribonuclease VII large subunit
VDLFEHVERRGSGGDPKPTVLSVEALTRAITGRLTAMGTVAVEGEVSQPKRAASGHLYFDLKDSGARISCIAWRSTVQSLRLALEGGEQLVLHGRLDVYMPRGSYSLIVERVERRGLGELLARLERTKAELRAEGWFDRKRPLPRWPRCVGVVTSRDGAGWQDFLRTLEQRWPDYPVRLAHARVQGQGSASEVVRAIDGLARSGVDLVCVIRGGGSIEDLWTFNERAVAEAVFRCPVPVVTGVGHQTDTTLVDFVSDHRAHTPTDAAVVAIPERAALLERLGRAEEHLGRAVEAALERREEALERLAGRPVLRDPRRLLDAPAQRLEALERDLRHLIRARGGAAREALADLVARVERRAPARQLDQRAAALERLAPRLRQAAHERLRRAEGRLQVAARTLTALSPLAVLERGYSITRGADGRAVRGSDQVAEGAELETVLARGRVRSRVVGVEPADGGGGIGSGSGSPEGAEG